MSIHSKLFADPFYNSREQSFLGHLFRVMTGWAVVCDVWYLPPQRQRDNETVLEFTNRVKKQIADRAGLINVEWDGYLKHFRPSPRFAETRRKLFAASFIQRFSAQNLKQLEAEFLAQEGKP
jgi:glycerol-3-phosphate O-acyltransferase 3/4